MLVFNNDSTDSCSSSTMTEFVVVTKKNKTGKLATANWSAVNMFERAGQGLYDVLCDGEYRIYLTKAAKQKGDVPTIYHRPGFGTSVTKFIKLVQLQSMDNCWERSHEQTNGQCASQW